MSVSVSFPASKNQIGGFVKSVYSKMLILSLTLTMSACNSSSDSGEKPNLNPAGVCVARSEGIVGGKRVGESDYDANKVVMLLSEDSNGDVELCTAAPIAPDVLLTAAHCITATASKTKAYTTTSALCNTGFDRTKSGIAASAVVVNENYNGVENSSLAAAIKSDVALVFLSSKLPSHYPVYKIADSQRQFTSSLYLYGYGAVSLTKKSSGVLRKTEIQDGRFEIDQSVKEVRIDQTYGKGVCSGDSGGPGLVYVDGEYQILGVNSYVSGRKDTDYCMNEGNLALADHYLSWIESKMAARGRQLKK